MNWIPFFASKWGHVRKELYLLSFCFAWKWKKTAQTDRTIKPWRTTLSFFFPSMAQKLPGFKKVFKVWQMKKKKQYETIIKLKVFSVFFWQGLCLSCIDWTDSCQIQPVQTPGGLSTITIHEALSLLAKWQMHFQRTYQPIGPCATFLV